MILNGSMHCAVAFHSSEHSASTHHTIQFLQTGITSHTEDKRLSGTLAQNKIHSNLCSHSHETHCTRCIKHAVCVPHEAHQFTMTLITDCIPAQQQCIFVEI